jgi:molybdate transport system substrate-binding protein
VVPSPSVAAAAAPAASSGAPVTGDILIFAAASLTESFNEIGMSFQAANPGARVAFNFAGSNTLAIQLDQGGQADAFASADTIQMGNAQKSGDLTSDPQIFAHNKLTIITPASNPGGVQQVCDLAKPGLKIVAAQTSVPVGQYTNDMLDKASTPDHCGEGFRQKVEANIVSRESDVRQLVAKVNLGEADAGVCYLTDVTAAVKPNVQEIAIPDDLNTIADYPIATTKGKNPAGGQAFMAYVLSPAGQDILAKWGFTRAR